jgi:disulfide bond formation protein DsbB
MQDLLQYVRSKPQASAAGFVVILGAATILGAYFIQYVLEYPPCPLCYEQRNAYYLGIPLAALLWLGANYGASNKVLMAGFAVIALAFLWNTGLATYHAGIEWKWWAGPADCSGNAISINSASDMLNRLRHINIVRCDQPALLIFGFSLAAWNAPISLALALAGAWGAKVSYERRTR